MTRTGPFQRRLAHLRLVLAVGLLACPAASPSGAAGLAAVEDKRLEKAYEHLNTAEDLFRRRDYKGAADEAGRAIRLVPGLVKAYNRRAAAYNLLGDYDLALEDIRTSLEREAKNPAAYEIMAWVNLKQNRPSEAIDSASRALQHNPASARAYLYSAFAKEMLGDMDGCLADIRQAAFLERDPAQRQKYNDMATMAERGTQIYNRRGDDASQLFVLESASAPSRFPWLLVAGVLLFAAGSGGVAWVLFGGRASGAAADHKPTDLDYRLAGKYELVRMVGRGGMGQVFEAVDHTLGRKVAIKRMSDRLAQAGTEGRAFFLKEAKTVAVVHHPAIVDIYEILESGSDLYLVFEYVRGKTLQQILAEERRISLERVLEVLRPVCQALEYAHSRNLVHRDLKPSNIMVTEQGYIKLMDFGIARAISDRVAHDQGGHSSLILTPPTPAPNRLTVGRTSTIVGTPMYMAPETEQGVVCKEADVYSLGVCLYEMVVGQSPFDEPVSLEQKLQMGFMAPSKKNPSLPKQVDELVIRALQPGRDLRIKTPLEFLKRLEAAARAAATA